MQTLQTSTCSLCGDNGFEKVFTYHAPPEGEVRFHFNSGTDYLREVRRCGRCGHFVSVHNMDEGALYSDDYVTSTYGADGIRKAFERITALDPAKSDNVGRVRRVVEFARSYLMAPARENRAPTVLDIGSGLCVFLHRMKVAGWDGTALDPDERAVRHAREVVGVRGVQGDFLTAPDLGQFDLVTFNKVLEHIKNPVAMLARSAGFLRPGGFVYLEVPDGEAAVADGPGREEFFIDHHHIFSAASLALLVVRAGFRLRALERLREPSSKYTLRAFLEQPPEPMGE
jgi:2-polyprenyl-3-methyl-5-hydroxy-6-metoxy-1,4-benzoquinol methylase